MKFIGVAALVVALSALTACSEGIILPEIIHTSDPFGSNPLGYKVLAEPLQKAWTEVSAHKYIVPATPLYQSPKQFDTADGGECVGFSIDMVYLLGPEASFAICTTDQYPAHAVVLYRGQYIEPQVFEKSYTAGGYTIHVVEIISYNDIMALATANGTK